ncbi:DUF1326 domain-containing protein [Sedimentitalea sp. JM2-8]|uniref:DUF1326 domain-containing protein n=1 Tax=Sedimentitalea xiamensis TaxID=3050037 RepID=A0ABT7FC04_9RHOB|nr:DUF1326 domain-containing protein [Sedimentitalea xiamensis]MDK3072558.1 DUF1326 domain-containing protein [Sedimentitalea xiamensis]
MAWHVNGTYMEACNCDTVCPCVFFSPPTEGDCTVVLGWHIDKGEFGDTTLDGLNVAMLAHSPGNMKDGNWKVALYLDDTADEAQSQALAGIFSGQAGGHLANLGPLIGEVLGARPATIRFDSKSADMKLAVEGLGQAEIAAIEGQGGGIVQLTGHPLAISPGEAATVARSKSTKISDYGLECNVSGKAGLFAPYAYSG